jgi:hypothetical protein
LGDREFGAAGAAAAFCLPFLFFWSVTGLFLVIVKFATSSCRYVDDEEVDDKERPWYVIGPVLLVIVANLCLCILYVPLMQVMDEFSLNVFGIERAWASVHGAMVNTSHPEPQVVGTDKIIVVTMHITPLEGSKLDLRFTAMSGDEVLGITYDKAVDNVSLIWPALAEALGESTCSIRLVSEDGELMHENSRELLRKLHADDTTLPGEVQSESEIKSSCPETSVQEPVPEIKDLPFPLCFATVR